VNISSHCLNNTAALENKLIITVGGLAVSDNPDAKLTTYSLGSCLGVTIYDPIVRAGGLLHAMLHESAINPAKAAERPGMDSPWVRAVAHWRAVGCRVAFVPASPAGWEAAVETLPCVVVRDAGLTEVEPGSRTVIALRPSDGAERDSWAHLLADGPQGH